MTRSQLLVSTVALALCCASGCRDVLAAGPDVTGAWQTDTPDFGYTLQLHQSGATVTGNGTAFGNINPPTRTLTVTGSSTTRGVTLTLSLSDSTTVLFQGQIEARNDTTVLTGTEHTAGGDGMLTFLRP